jgi:hypothetical protein
MSVYLIEGDSSLECFKQSFTTMAVTTGFNQISNMGKRFLSLMNNNGRGMYVSRCFKGGLSLCFFFGNSEIDRYGFSYVVMTTSSVLTSF